MRTNRRRTIAPLTNKKVATAVGLIAFFCLSLWALFPLRDEPDEGEQGFLFASVPAAPRVQKLLSILAEGTDVTSLEHAFSEQRFPVLVDSLDELPAPLKVAAESQVAKLPPAVAADAELEMWPAWDNYGRLTWAIARWRRGDGGSQFEWAFFGPSPARAIARSEPVPEAVLPWTRSPRDPNEFREIFEFPPRSEKHYWFLKPFFADCLWIDEETREPIAGWMPLKLAKNASVDQTLITKATCVVLPQPFRVAGSPTSLLVKVHSTAQGKVEITWPEGVGWLENEAAEYLEDPKEFPAMWPERWNESLVRDLEVVSGAREATFPLSRRAVTFARCECDQVDNQLGDVADYLAERYGELGIRSWKEPVVWRNRGDSPPSSFSNVLAVLNGTDDQLPPVVLSAHYDMPFCEDTDSPRASPGADDNGSGTVALLHIASALRRFELQRSVIFLHTAGEEFPADCLGARAFASSIVGGLFDVHLVVVLDMIGWNKRGSEPTFQVHPTSSSLAAGIADVFERIARNAAPGLRLLNRPRWSKQSFVYNTDAVVFDALGIPAILINEHFSYYDDFWRANYHDQNDLVDAIDLKYFSSIVNATAALIYGITTAESPDR